MNTKQFHFLTIGCILIVLFPLTHNYEHNVYFSNNITHTDILTIKSCSLKCNNLNDVCFLVEYLHISCV